MIFISNPEKTSYIAITQIRKFEVRPTDSGKITPSIYAQGNDDEPTIREEYSSQTMAMDALNYLFAIANNLPHMGGHKFTAFNTIALPTDNDVKRMKFMCDVEKAEF